MMKRVAFVAVVFGLPTASFFAHAESQIRKCDFDLKGGCRSGEARITLVDGNVTRVEVDVIGCGRGGHGKSLDFACTIDSSRGDGESTWLQDAGATVIIGSSPYADATKPDRIKVTGGADVSIDLNETQSIPRCGAGAELPQSIVIPARGKVCRVRFSEP